MKRLTSIIALAFGLVAASFAQGASTSVHISGGDGTSWAVIRVSGGGVAHIDQLGGLHIGDVRKDEVIVVRAGKGYIITEGKVFSDLEAAGKPMEKLRAERLSDHKSIRDLRGQQRDIDRERRNLDRERSSIDRQAAREGETGKIDRDRMMKDLEAKMRDLEAKEKTLANKLAGANKKSEANSKTADAERTAYEKKVEGILSAAISSGVAKPYTGQ